MDSRDSKFVISLFYVVKNIKKQPEKTIKFIEENRKLFPEITDVLLEKLREEAKALAIKNNK